MSAGTHSAVTRQSLRACISHGSLLLRLTCGCTQGGAAQRAQRERRVCRSKVLLTAVEWSYELRHALR